MLLSVFNLALIVTLAGILRMARRRIGNVNQVVPEPRARWPAISVIVAARNEARNIEVALRSLLDLDYEPVEVIVIDDRSEDDTLEILARMQAANARLRVLRVTELPPGWLGKNHALHQGAEQAGGEYLLFTDADVVLHPDILRRAVAYVERQRVDHLALAPHAVVPTMLMQAFVVFFTNMFLLYTRPWKVSDPNSSAFVGIGAFNFVRKTAYFEAGAYRAIAMRPDDDVKLGKIIKRRGFRQAFLNGAESVSMPWYGSLRELIEGMEKNAFSGVDYSIGLVIVITIVLLVFDIWPFVAVWVLAGIPRVIYALVIGCLVGNAWVSARQARVTGWAALLLPAAVLLLVYIQWRAMLLTYLQGGIRWRGTLYPLDELRHNQV